MSVFTTIKDSTQGAPKTKEWYRSQLFQQLGDYTGGFSQGDIIYFNYSPSTPAQKLPWYDAFPMVQIMQNDAGLLQFEGGNLHYLRPEMRQSVAKTWGSGGLQYPIQCHHKYFMSNATNIKVVPREEFVDMVPLPVEKFYTSVGSRWIDIPSSFIWSKL